MNFPNFDQEPEFLGAWHAVEIKRRVHYSLFTFGESDLEYYLVCEPEAEGKLVTIRRGEVKVTKPMIITPDNFNPEFRDFFENAEEEQIADFIMARTASFSHLKFENRAGEAHIISDSMEEAVDRLNRQLDDEEEDRIAILTAPAHYAGLAVMKYALERVWESTPDNLQELRERGFLP